MRVLGNAMERYLFVDVFVCVHVHTAVCSHHDVPAEVRGQLKGDVSHCLSCANAVLSLQCVWSWLCGK